jgi:bifunctional UDP-N-acetylglucosamine pyrophosphorylase/glucosamine-1-phosphate N-acetyltransferase
MTQTESNSTAAIILAAGKGTRMRSTLPKVLHEVARQPMLAHVMQAAAAAGCDSLTVITGPAMPEVGNCAQAVNPNSRIAIQQEALGTGHAVMAARETLRDHDGNLVVLFGDSPLIQAETISMLIDMLAKDPRCAVAVLGFETSEPGAYGRLVIQNGELARIIEAKDAKPEELAITACNAGIMAIRGNLAWDMLEQIAPHNAQGEYYLTDIIDVARRLGYRCLAMMGPAEEALGVNSRAQLAEIEAIFQNRLRRRALDEGVTMIAPETVFLAADTEFGTDVLIEPNVVFGPNVVVGDGVEIRAFSHLEGAVIGDRALIGPFARLRPGSNIGEECKIGNFVEIKKAQIERDVKISHLSYIGDAHVGENSNIGAGTITCNYDGYKKYHTEIGQDVFIGSNSALVAPIVIGSGAYVGAGSVVTENVAPDSLAVARSRQSFKSEWAKNFRARMEKK